MQVYPANQNGIIPNMTSEIIVQTAEELIELGVTLGSLLRGGETIELVGDIGAGKTTLTKGLARGMGIAEEVQSPTFTLSRVYDAPNGRRLAHYDFYRLNNAGIMQAELLDNTAIQHENELLTKLSALFKMKNTSWIEVDFNNWQNNKMYEKTFNDIKFAILSKNIISFTYFKIGRAHV